MPLLGQTPHSLRRVLSTGVPRLTQGSSTSNWQIRNIVKSSDTKSSECPQLFVLFRYQYITSLLLYTAIVCRITEHLGSGQFGTVNKGIWQSPAGAMEVAVKTLQSSASQEDRVKFLQEAAINGQFRHPNVVKLLGVVTVGEPVSVMCLH